jgi:hypothetical protein
MHLSESQISLYADALRNNSEGKLPANILEHVEECLLCKHEVLEIVSILSDIEEAEKLKPKGVIPSYFFYWKAAAVILILLVPGYFLYTYHTPEIVQTASTTKNVSAEPNKGPLAGEKKSAIQNLKQNNFAVNDIYAPIPEYDEICGENFRSDKFFDVTSPSLSVKSKGKIKFDISFKNKIERTVTVFNNKNEQVFYKKFNQDVIVIEHSFSPGLYYWKLETPSDLIYISKFTIVK